MSLNLKNTLAPKSGLDAQSLDEETLEVGGESSTVTLLSLSSKYFTSGFSEICRGFVNKVI